MGLGSTCLEKLSLTWAHGDKHQRLDSFRTLVDPANEFTALRSACKNIKGPCIPHMSTCIVQFTKRFILFDVWSVRDVHDVGCVDT